MGLLSLANPSCDLRELSLDRAEPNGIWIAQDTGGAIKGAVRGDLYFGTGPEAGERAGTMNAPGRLWVFLPKGVAARIHTSDMATLGFHAGAP